MVAVRMFLDMLRRCPALLLTIVLMLAMMVSILNVFFSMVAIVTMRVDFRFHRKVSVPVPTPLTMLMLTFLLQSSMAVRVVRMRASMMSARMLVAVQNPHDVEIAEQAKDRSSQHDLRLLDYLPVENSASGLDGQLESDQPDDRHIYQRSQGLHLFVAEGEGLGTRLVTLVDCVQRDHVGRDVREEMEGVGEDGDRVRIVSSEEFDGHEDQGDDGDLAQFRNYDAVLFVHYNYMQQNM